MLVHIQPIFCVMARLAQTCLLSVCLIAAARAEDAQAAIQRTFVTGWIAAINSTASNSKDPARVQRFLHPQVQACINGASREFFDYVLERETRYAPIGKYSITKIAPMSEAPPEFLPGDSFVYPVKPVYELNLDIGSTVLIRYLAPANGSWYEVYPCPNAKGIVFMHEQMAKGAEQQLRAQKLFSELRDPLRAELITLLKQSRRIEAVNRYQQSTGEQDMAIAMAVMKLLLPPEK